MIDYEKLKLAHDLLKKITDKQWFFRQFITRNFSYDASEIEETSYMLSHPNEYDEEFKYIDDLIIRIKELSEPKPKYEIGQEIWFLEGNATASSIIKDMTGDPIKLWLEGRYCFYEVSCYPSRESLVQAQIDYWQNLLIKENVKSFEKASIALVNEHIKDTGIKLEIKECQHESDGGWYYSHGERICGAALHFANAKPDKYKCKKCGEFY